MSVSRGTLAEAASPTGYFSPARVRRMEDRREKVIAAAMVLIQAGNYRPTTTDIAAQAEVCRSAISQYFGCQELLWRDLARTRWKDIALLAGLQHLEEREQERVVWLVMTGTRKSLP